LSSRRRRRGSRVRASFVGGESVRQLVDALVAADMRGSRPHDRVCDREQSRPTSVEHRPLAARSCVAGCSSRLRRCALLAEAAEASGLLHRRQRPAVTGELARDRDALRGDTRCKSSTPLTPSSTPACVVRTCTSNPTQLPSAIPAPPVIAALPPGLSRRQPAPTYERGAGQSIRSSPRTAQPAHLLGSNSPDDLTARSGGYSCGAQLVFHSKPPRRDAG
jgi:hypothetical protein